MKECLLCSEPAVSKGLCNRHYIRWRRHKNPTITLHKITQTVTQLEDYGELKFFDKTGKLKYTIIFDKEETLRIEKKEWSYHTQIPQIFEKETGLFLSHYILKIIQGTLQNRQVIFKEKNTDYRKKNLKIVYTSDLKQKKKLTFSAANIKKGRYPVIFNFRNQKYFLGIYASMEEANEAYIIKLKELRGENTILNIFKNEY